VPVLGTTPSITTLLGKQTEGPSVGIIIRISSPLPSVVLVQPKDNHEWPKDLSVYNDTLFRSYL